jgi:hypothetical protein
MTDDHFNTPEAWKAIPDFPGYEVSDQGRVRSFWRKGKRGQGNGRGANSVLSSTPQRILNPSIVKGDYRRITLCKDDRKHNFFVHIQVLNAFIGPCPPGLEGCHNDGKPANNSLINLRWDTRSSNQLDRRKHGTVTCQLGEKNRSAKLIPENIIEIRKLVSQGYRLKEVAEKFGIAESNVCQIAKRKTWTHV